MPQMQLTAYAAADDQIAANITATPVDTYEDGIIDVDIDLTGIPYQGKVVPNDIVLIIDRSGSMADKISNMISAALKFVDIVDVKKHRIGVVDFSDHASSLALTSDKTALKEYIAKIVTASGGTNTAEAVNTAVTVLRSKRNNADGAIVLMTDGKANSKPDALSAARTAKNCGYSFYTVALTDSEQSEANLTLREMATSEADHYFIFSSTALSEVYEKIAAKIGYANAKNVVVSQVIGDQFELVAGSTDSTIPIPTISGKKIRWEMNQLGQGTSHLKYQLKIKDTTAPGTYPHVSAGSILYTDYNGAVRSITPNKVSITVRKHAPEITSVNQTDFDTLGGETVVLQGKYFNSGATVMLGTTTIANSALVFNGTTEISFTMPAHAAGSDTITVVNPDGQTSNTQTVNFVSSQPLPTLTITPDSGPEKRTQQVTVTGVTFKAKKSKNITVTVGGVACSVTSYNSKKDTIKFYVPRSFAGSVQEVAIKDSDGTVYTTNYTYIGKIPVIMSIASISPDSGLEKKTQQVTITGTGFAKKSKLMTVTLDGEVMSLTRCNETSLSFYVPRTKTAGAYEIIVTNNETGENATTKYTYTGNPPIPFAVTGITPDSGPEKKTQQVTITGTGFATSSKQMTVTLDGEVMSLTRCSANSLSFYVPRTKTAGAYNVVVTKNETGENATIQYTYDVDNTIIISPVSISNITPSSGIAKKTQQVTITGAGFAEKSKQMKVTLDGEVMSLTRCSANSLSFYVPRTKAAGTYEIEVTNTVTGKSATTSYEYIDP